MKNKYVVILAFALTLTCFFSNAQNKYMPSIDLDLIEVLEEHYTPSDNIFFIDPGNNMVLVDFQSIKDRIIRIDIKQKDQLVFEEDVQHLATQTIYELPAALFKAGICKVELVTSLGFKYSQEIRIQPIVENTISMD